MEQFSVCVFGAGLLAATSVFAQSSMVGERYYITGYGEFGNYDSGTSDSVFYRLDIDMGLKPLPGNNGFGIGFSLGVDAYGESGDDANALYPAIELGTGIGKFSVGVPRSVLDRGYFPGRKFANNTSVDLELRHLEASFVGAFYLRNSDPVYGLRYDGSFGNTKVGASYHYLDLSGGSADAYALAVNHTFAGPSSMVDFMLYGGVEYLSSGSGNSTKYRIGAEGNWEKITAGISYANLDTSPNTQLVTAYLDYMILDNLTVTGSYGRIDTTSAISVYGVGVQYDFFRNAYLKASVLDTDASGSDPFYEVALGWKF